ncbi:MAG: UDP-N-acetylmuramate--L-alanine ligase [Desulfobacterota bacterium]|nr:UDP-N-acetylmuramate--L-alanine ligase [Thermodesulfobacteriota bacterium]
MYKKDQHIHFIGIGGIGMSGIAELLLNLGYRVSGSDLKKSEITEHLAKCGARIFYGHDRKHITDIDVAVVSSAVRPDNPEVMCAQERNIPVIPRAAMLAELMRLKYGIAIAGAHGKTTTTSLVAAVLQHGGLDPTIVIGGKLIKTDANAVLGTGDFLVAEADESDGSFLNLPPTIAVVTNIDREHMDFYQDIEQIKDAFLAFINKVPFYGLAVICLDDPHIQSIIPRIKKRMLTYGCASQADLQARDITLAGFKTSFAVYHHEKRLGGIKLHLPGMHNVYNALAAIGVGIELSLPFQTIKKALWDCRGIQRRLQVRGTKQGIVWIDDYGHHPTEIKMTLRAVRNIAQQRIVVVFQPHRYSRTYHLFQEFLTAFYDADVLLLTDIYPAGEEPCFDISARHLYEGLREYGHKDVRLAGTLEEAAALLPTLLQPGDVLVTLGAGDVWKVGHSFIKSRAQRGTASRTQG